MSLRIYKAGEAAEVMQCSRQIIDAACFSGALFAVDNTPNSTRRSWRIDEDALRDWHRAGRPATPEAAK